MYNHYIIAVGLKLGYTISKVLDRGVIELLGPYGLSSALNRTALSISLSDTRVISTYSTYIIFNALVLIFIVFSPILVAGPSLFELRLIIIYIAASLFVISPGFRVGLAPSH